MEPQRCAPRRTQHQWCPVGGAGQRPCRRVASAALCAYPLQLLSQGYMVSPVLDNPLMQVAGMLVEMQKGGILKLHSIRQATHHSVPASCPPTLCTAAVAARPAQALVLLVHTPRLGACVHCFFSLRV